ncbi:MAG: 4-hydroxythreonine-4-phosphate dehydrogenase PdxA [Planctomycetota bacterium]
MTRPVVALSVGDPCGIGPEVAWKLLAAGDLPARVLLLADARVLARDRALAPGAPALPPLVDAEAFAAGDAPFALDAEADAASRAVLPALPPHGRVHAGAGAAGHAWVLRGADLARAGTVDALVTGPIHKEAWAAAGIGSIGHTEALAARARAPRVVMMLAGGPLRVALATIHVPLARVPGLLTVAGLLADLRIVRADLVARFGVSAPRIAVCGLNPHAGEGGLLGREDLDVIAPAVAAARAEGIDAVGPLPADAAVPAAADGRYDAVLAMFHDQGLPAVKTLAPRTAVNVTLGLPFVRTSVDHGTAFDVAGRGVATATSLRSALDLAVALASRSTKGVGGPT